MAAPYNAELLDSVIEVTGVNELQAQQLLQMADNNVQTALTLFFEQGLRALGIDEGDDDEVALGNGVLNGNAAANINDVEGGGAATAPQPAPATFHYPNIDSDGDEEDGYMRGNGGDLEMLDDVRAPIAPRREQLLGPEDDNFLHHEPPLLLAHRRPKQNTNAPRVRMCPLRDFAREGALMEEQMALEANNPNNPANLPFNPINLSATAPPDLLPRNGLQKSSRLEDLFRPPTDIAYPGTFVTARNQALKLKQWLLVNVQSDNFNSHLLNRDVWSNVDLRKVMQNNFLLWQVLADNLEGRRFISFYHCNDLPYVCVVDPLTGEELWHSDNPKLETVLPDLLQFLAEHKKAGELEQQDEEDYDGPSTSRRAAGKRTKTVKMDASSVTVKIPKRPKVMELSEEEQLAIAIRNSMREEPEENADEPTEETFDSESGESVEDLSSNAMQSKAAAAAKAAAPTEPPYQSLLDANCKETTKIKLRLQNEKGEDEMVLLQWPSNTKLEALRCYISQCHPHLQQHTYTLICAFPRTVLGQQHNALTLKEAGLHPSANLHYTTDE